MFVYTKYSKCECITSYKAYEFKAHEGDLKYGFITDNYGSETFIVVGNPSQHLDYKGQFELVSEDRIVGGVVVFESRLDGGGDKLPPAPESEPHFDMDGDSIRLFAFVDSVRVNVIMGSTQATLAFTVDEALDVAADLIRMAIAVKRQFADRQ